MSEFQAGLVFFSVVFGVAFAAWWVKGVVGRILDRWAESRRRVGVRPGITAYLGILFASCMTPAAAAGVAHDAGGGGGILLTARSFLSLARLRRKIAVDHSGGEIIDFLRNHKLAWSEIVRIGPVRYEEVGTTLGFETRGKGPTSPLLLTDAGAENPRAAYRLRTSSAKETGVRRSPTSAAAKPREPLHEVTQV